MKPLERLTLSSANDRRRGRTLAGCVAHVVPGLRTTAISTKSTRTDVVPRANSQKRLRLKRSTTFLTLRYAQRSAVTKKSAGPGAGHLFCRSIPW